MAETSTFLSVIIPVYNAAPYLESCLGSVLEDGTLPLEVILVNDGSTDASGEICEAFTARDARVRALHQQNGGASAARNAGIRVALGEYILFVDADDAVRPGALKEIIRRARDEGPCDVAFLTGDKIGLDGRMRPFSHRYDRARVYGQSPQAVLAYLTALSHYPVAPCVKLLRRTFVHAHDLLFREGMVCEDVDHTYRVLLAAQSFNYLDTPYYVVHAREGSVMTSPANARRRYDSTLWILTHWTGEARTDARRETILAFLAAQFVYLCALYADLPPGDRRQQRQAVKGYAWLLAHGRNQRFTLLRIMWRLLGLNASAHIFRIAFL